MDKEAFFGGTWCAAADWFGAHPECGGFRFRLWAPHARAVRLAGDFSGWEQIPMQCADGVWECFVPGAKDYDSYKFCLTRADGRPALRRTVSWHLWTMIGRTMHGKRALLTSRC